MGCGGKSEIFAAKNVKSPWKVGQILTNKSFLFASLGWGLELMAMLGISTVGVNILIEKGVSSGMAVTVASFIGLVGFVSSIASGYLSDKIGHKNASILLIIVFALGCLLLAVAPVGSIGLMIVAYYLAFSSNGFSNNLSNTIFLKLSGPAYFSAVFTVCFTVVQLIRAFASSLFAFSLTHLGGYVGALYICVVLLVVAIIFILIAGDKLQVHPSDKQAKSQAESDAEEA